MKNIFKKISTGFKKVISVIKKKWLAKITTTIILMMIFIALFILLNSVMHSLNLNPIDITSEGINSLTDETKTKLSNIDKPINILMMNFSEDSKTYKIVKQYENVNKNIKTELIDLSARTDLAQKYSVGTQDGPTIIIICGDKNKKISSYELATYDYTTGEEIDLTEERVTATILGLIAEKLSNVYVIDNYADEYFRLDTYMNLLNSYITKEAMNINKLDILVSGNVPDDCDLLLIVSPLKDFETQTTDEIIKYINKGGNILWLQGAYGKDLSMPNVQKVLDLYGINAFTTGCVLETNANNRLSEDPRALVINVSPNDIIGTENLKVAFFVSTRISTKSDEDLQNLKVTKTNLITTESTALFRKDFTSTSISKIDTDEEGPLTLGAMFEKEISGEGENKTISKLVMYSNECFASSIPYSQNYQDGWIDLGNNKDLVLNTSLYLTNSEIDINIRKNTNIKHFTMTDTQYRVILAIIFVVPVLIIILGIIVWQIRRRKK